MTLSVNIVLTLPPNTVYSVNINTECAKLSLRLFEIFEF